MHTIIHIYTVLKKDAFNILVLRRIIPRSVFRKQIWTETHKHIQSHSLTRTHTFTRTNSRTRNYSKIFILAQIRSHLSTQFPSNTHTHYLIHTLTHLHSHIHFKMHPHTLFKLNKIIYHKPHIIHTLNAFNVLLLSSEAGFSLFLSLSISLPLSLSLSLLFFNPFHFPHIFILIKIFFPNPFILYFQTPLVPKQL